MARQLIVVGIVLFVLLALGAGGLYAFNYYSTADAPTEAIVAPVLDTKPDNTVLAGPVQQSSAASITITKQDGSPVTLGITPDTHIVMVTASSTTKSAVSSDLTVGAMVLITPLVSDATIADSIVITMPPPTAAANK